MLGATLLSGTRSATTWRKPLAYLAPARGMIAVIFARRLDIRTKQAAEIVLVDAGRVPPPISPKPLKQWRARNDSNVRPSDS